ncbi:hypothetical protein [Pyxidicoccus sp. MSG2]|uniref:hypothetical protein n=1 Tax=Pyxidicoccus sp. MSG2 TaxID=2996790 RepID=UPI00226EBE97|nr:hypothetical protein [Pyxidicoccus sp. MSG2]MCY1016017.1 hypothetical protein [Pyxidicoccus sp. MSG2]
MPDIRVVLLVLGLFPGMVLAQSTEPLQPPPLIGVEDVVEGEEAEPVPPEALPSRATPELEWAPEPPGRVAGRVLLESMGGAVGGVGGAFMGLVATLPFGGLELGCDGDVCDGSGLVGSALVGWSLGAALGVYGSGSMLEGRGRFLPTVGLGLLAGGASAGLYMSGALEGEATPLLIILPLATSIITYEVTSSWNQPGPRALAAASHGSGTWWTPTVGVSSRGGSLGLMGRF